MPAGTRIKMTIYADGTQAQAVMRHVEQSIRKPEAAMGRMSKHAKSWGQRMMTAAKHLAGAYVAFRSISFVQGQISASFQHWVQYLDRAKQLSFELADAQRDILLMTEPGKLGDVLKSVREITMQRPFGMREPHAAFAIVRSMLTEQMGFSERQRQAALKTALDIREIYSGSVEEIATVVSKAFIAAPKRTAEDIGDVISAGMVKAAAGGQELAEWLKAMPRVTLQKMMERVTFEQAIGFGAVAPAYAPGPRLAARASQRMMERLELIPKHLQRLFAGIEPKDIWSKLERVAELLERGQMSAQQLTELVGARYQSMLGGIGKGWDKVVATAKALEEAGKGEFLKERFKAAMTDPVARITRMEKVLDTWIKTQEATAMPGLKMNLARKVLDAVLRASYLKGDITGFQQRWVQGHFMLRRFFLGTEPGLAIRKALEQLRVGGGPRRPWLEKPGYAREVEQYYRGLLKASPEELLEKLEQLENFGKQTAENTNQLVGQGTQGAQDWSPDRDYAR